MFIKKFLITLCFTLPITSFASTKLILIQSEDNTVTTTEYYTDQKTLQNKALKALVKETASSAIDLDWDEGARLHESFRDNDSSQFHIDEMIIRDGLVIYMSVIINGTYKESTIDGSFEGSYSCTVDLERYELGDDLVSEYAICETDLGEEIIFEG